jgi:hypothetical protein
MLKKLLGSDASVAAPVARRNPQVKRRTVKKARRARGWIA